MHGETQTEGFLGSLNELNEYTLSDKDSKKVSKIHIRLMNNRNDFVSRTKKEYY
jgi:hypothetical protein